MLTNLFTYLTPFIQVVIPLFFIYRLWTKDFNIKASWIIQSFHALLTLVLIFFLFRWDLVGYDLRYWLYGIYALALILSVIKVKNVPFYQKGQIQYSWMQPLEIALFIAAMTWIIAGFTPEKKGVDLNFPLKGESYNVLHGGSTAALNYHGAFAKPQKYALDINQLTDWGIRAKEFFPDQLDDYAVFSDTVYSPVAGTVVQAVDSLPDQTPPKRLPDKPAGNHIWIHSDSLYVILAHLKHQSIMFKTGQKIHANQPIAQVGNTGNTTEPHLHIHAVTFPQGPVPEADSLLYGGEPVPLIFDGRFLIRNSTF